MGDADTRRFRNRSPAKKRPEVIRLNTEIEIHVEIEIGIENAITRVI